MDGSHQRPAAHIQACAILINPYQSLGSRALQESPCLGINRAAGEIIVCCIPYVKMNGRIEFGEFNQIRFAKITLFMRWLCRTAANCDEQQERET